MLSSIPPAVPDPVTFLPNVPESPSSSVSPSKPSSPSSSSVADIGRYVPTGAIELVSESGIARPFEVVAAREEEGRDEDEAAAEGGSRLRFLRARSRSESQRSSRAFERCFSLSKASAQATNAGEERTVDVRA